LVDELDDKSVDQPALRKPTKTALASRMAQYITPRRRPEQFTHLYEASAGGATAHATYQPLNRSHRSSSELL